MNLSDTSVLSCLSEQKLLGFSFPPSPSLVSFSHPFFEGILQYHLLLSLLVWKKTMLPAFEGFF